MRSPLSSYSVDTDTIDNLPPKMGPPDQKVLPPNREGRGYSARLNHCHHEKLDRTDTLRAVFRRRRIIRGEVCQLCGEIFLTEPEDPKKT